MIALSCSFLVSVSCPGCNAPNHFLIETSSAAGTERVFVDPLHGGRVLDLAACLQALQIDAADLPGRGASTLPQLFLRMFRNLVSAFQQVWREGGDLISCFVMECCVKWEQGWFCTFYCDIHSFSSTPLFRSLPTLPICMQLDCSPHMMHSCFSSLLALQAVQNMTLFQPLRRAIEHFSVNFLK